MGENTEHGDNILLVDKGRVRVRGEAETAREFMLRWHKKPNVADTLSTRTPPSQTVHRTHRLTREETDDY